MNVYSRTSQANLASCDPRLRRLFNTVLSAFDHSIIEGARDLERQKRLFEAKKSKTMKSKHLVDEPGDYSQAVDAVPYPHSWAFEAEILQAARSGDEVALKRVLHSIQRWAIFVGHVLMTAHLLGIPLRWGGDWDSDKDLTDQNFDDWPHFELVE